MLVELKTVKILNEGFKTEISIENVYINPAHIISVKDYVGINKFLLSEKMQLSKERFSLVKVNNVNGTEDIITLGTSSEILKAVSNSSKGKQLLND